MADQAIPTPAPGRKIVTGRERQWRNLLAEADGWRAIVFAEKDHYGAAAAKARQLDAWVNMLRADQ